MEEDVQRPLGNHSSFYKIKLAEEEQAREKPELDKEECTR